MVVAFDIFEDLLSCVVVVFECGVLEGFSFERGEKTLGRGIVPAVSFATHALLDAELGKSQSKRTACVLNAAVRMKDGATLKWLTAACHVERIERDARGKRITHRPADDFSRRHVKHGTQIQKAAVCSNVG